MKVLGVKGTRILVATFSLSISWVYTLYRQTFALASGTSVRSTMRLFLVRTGLYSSNFCSIEIEVGHF
jgi:hypothetical protein